MGPVLWAVQEKAWLCSVHEHNYNHHNICHNDEWHIDYSRRSPCCQSKAKHYDLEDAQRRHEQDVSASYHQHTKARSRPHESTTGLWLAWLCPCASSTS